jgi:3-oxoacyl-[acyl-carrier-protein] synthase III
MRVDNLHIAGLGTSLPRPFPAEEAVALGLYDETEWKNSGWTGATVAGGISAPDMAVEAARRALSHSGHTRTEVALLLHATVFDQGPEMWTPHTYVLRHALGTRVPALEVRQGCNAALGAMELAHGYLSADPSRVAALVTAGENFGTDRVDRWRYGSGARTNRGSIAGDAASAMVLSTRQGFARVKAINSTSLPDLEEMNRPHGPLFPPMLTTGGVIEVGRRMGAFADREPAAAAAAKTALQSTRAELGLQAIADAGLVPDDITRVTHVLSGGEEYIRSVVDPMGIDPAKGMLEFGRQVGHMTTSDHLAALHHLVESRQVTEGDHVLMLNNGSGVSLTAAVVQITALPSWATGAPQTYEERI